MGPNGKAASSNPLCIPLPMTQIARNKLMFTPMPPRDEIRKNMRPPGPFRQPTKISWLPPVLPYRSSENHFPANHKIPLNRNHLGSKTPIPQEHHPKGGPHNQGRMGCSRGGHGL